MTWLRTWLRTQLLTWPRSQVILRAVISVGPVLALVASLPAGAHPWWTLFLLVFVLSVGSAVATDSVMGLVAMLIVMTWWAARVPDPLSAWVLAAVAALLVTQAALVLADYGPPSLDLDPDLLRLWLRRAGIVFPVAPVAWLVARLADGAPDEPSIWVAGLAGCLAAVVLAVLGLRPRESLSQDDDRRMMDHEEYIEQVLACVERIPRGRVTTYGAIAEAVGKELGGGGPRQVGSIMASYGGPVPWWRVVRADGSLPPSHQGEARQAYLEENTPMRPSGNVDLRRALWKP